MEQPRQCPRRPLVPLFPRVSRSLPRRLFPRFLGSSSGLLAARFRSGAPTPTAGGRWMVVAFARLVSVRLARPVDRSLVISGAGASTASLPTTARRSAAQDHSVSPAAVSGIAPTAVRFGLRGRIREHLRLAGFWFGGQCRLLQLLHPPSRPPWTRMLQKGLELLVVVGVPGVGVVAVLLMVARPCRSAPTIGVVRKQRRIPSLQATMIAGPLGRGLGRSLIVQPAYHRGNLTLDGPWSSHCLATFWMVRRAPFLLQSRNSLGLMGRGSSFIGLAQRGSFSLYRMLSRRQGSMAEGGRSSPLPTACTSCVGQGSSTPVRQPSLSPLSWCFVESRPMLGSWRRRSNYSTILVGSLDFIRILSTGGMNSS